MLCIQHVDFETPGVIGNWAQKNQHSFEVIHPYKGDLFPVMAEYDVIISMGGPQTPRDAAHLPYLKEEVNMLKAAILANKHVLGFCLGAQLIGEALGATTEQSPEKEVGVFPITLTEQGRLDPLFKDFPPSFPVIHWHRDMPGATHESALLASSEGCPIQAYRYGQRVYGLQFHMEITSEGIRDLMANAPEDLSQSRYTQSTEKLLRQDYTPIHSRMFTLLDRLMRL